MFPSVVVVLAFARLSLVARPRGNNLFQMTNWQAFSLWSVQCRSHSPFAPRFAANLKLTVNDSCFVVHGWIVSCYVDQSSVPWANRFTAVLQCSNSNQKPKSGGWTRTNIKGQPQVTLVVTSGCSGLSCITSHTGAFYQVMKGIGQASHLREFDVPRNKAKTGKSHAASKLQESNPSILAVLYQLAMFRNVLSLLPIRLKSIGKESNLRFVIGTTKTCYMRPDKYHSSEAAVLPLNYRCDAVSVSTNHRTVKRPGESFSAARAAKREPVDETI